MAATLAPRGAGDEGDLSFDSSCHRFSSRSADESLAQQPTTAETISPQ
jgi:hypothetical protein